MITRDIHRAVAAAAAAVTFSALAATAPADAARRAAPRLTAGQAAQLKGFPGVITARAIPKAARPRKCPSTPGQYFYSGLEADAGPQQRIPATGAAGSFTQPAPALGACDSHTLAELALIDPRSNNIVEVGWTVDRLLFGDTRPRLFVFHWHDGRPGCYNGCGFVNAPDATIKPGDPVAVSTTPRDYAIEHAGDRWNVLYAGDLVGWFPDSLWNGAFTSAPLVQWFGEVVAQPGGCTDMGTGVFGTAPTGAATVTNARLSGSVPGRLGLVAEAQTRHLYDDRLLVDASGYGVSYGGPGAC